MEEELIKINYIINVTSLALAVVFQTLFFVRFKFKADKAAILILLTFLLVMAVRVF
jgi:hypothetical protein